MAEFQGHDSPINQESGRPTPETFRWAKGIDKTLRDQEAALALKAPLASPTFTGDPKVPTAAPGDNDTSAASTAFVTAAIAAIPSAGAVFEGTVAASSGTTKSVTDISAWKVLIVAYAGISHNNGASQTLRFALSNNNGSSYGAATNMFSTAVAAAVSGSGVLVIFDSPSGHIFQSSFAAQILGGVEGTTGVSNAIQFSWSAGDFDDLNGTFNVYTIP